MTGSPDFNLWKLSTDNGKMVNRTPLFPLQYFLIILCYGLVHPLTSGGFNLDAIEGIFDSRIRCLVFWINHEIFFSFFQWQLLSKEPSCLDIQVMKTAEQLIAFNIMIIKFWSKKKESNILDLRRSGSDIHRSLDPSVITVAFILTNVQVQRIRISKRWEDEIYVL